MSYTTAITDIRTAMKTARTAWSGSFTLKVEYDGLDTIDVSAQVDPYLVCEIAFLDGEQLDLGVGPLAADYGQIHLTARARVGQAKNTLNCAAILEHFRTALERKNFSLVRTRVAIPHKAYSELGWYCWPVLVPFWYQRLAS